MCERGSEARPRLGWLGSLLVATTIAPRSSTLGMAVHERGREREQERAGRVSGAMSKRHEHHAGAMGEARGTASINARLVRGCGELGTKSRTRGRTKERREKVNEIM